MCRQREIFMSRLSCVLCMKNLIIFKFSHPFCLEEFSQSSNIVQTMRLNIFVSSLHALCIQSIFVLCMFCVCCVCFVCVLCCVCCVCLRVRRCFLFLTLYGHVSCVVVTASALPAQRAPSLLHGCPCPTVLYA